MQVAEEHDEQALGRLGRALRELGEAATSEKWGVGSSQETRQWRVALPDGIVTVTAVTCMGLRVEGPEDVVRRIREAYRAIAAG